MARSSTTLQEYYTTMSPAEVLAEAKTFFSRRSALYPAFLEHDTPQFCSFRGQGGEEILIAAMPGTSAGAGTRVTGSTYLFDQQVARFFSTLPSVEASPALPAAASASVAS
jgi:hypothetical protein